MFTAFFSIDEIIVKLFFSVDEINWGHSGINVLMKLQNFAEILKVF